MNPLIEKFEEVYGKKPEPGGLIEQLAAEQLGAAGNDTISFGSSSLGTDVISLNPAYISNGITISSHSPLSGYKRGFEIPNQTSVEQQFCKVMQNVADGKATVSAINAEIDQSFTGFGGQIRYTVEIIATYP